MECIRNQSYAKMGLPKCPKDAAEVIVRKATGDARMVLCTDHVKAYRAANIVVIR